MAFSEIRFIVFFIIVYLVLMCVKGVRKIKPKLGKQCYCWVLMISSYLFMGLSNYRFCIYIAFLTVVVFGATRVSASKKRMICGVTVCIAGLAFCKYSNFFIDEFNRVSGMHLSTLNLIAPVGISFYTFSAIGYIVDVFRDTFRQKSSLLNVALYLSYFPKLVSGPLISAEKFFSRLEKTEGVQLKNFERGIQFFVFGLFKKIVLADHLSVFVDDVFRAPSAFATISIWLAVVGYAFQLYFDFSGYSDMAMGISSMLGIELERNFNLPYLSRNLTEFWKRWHISLSSWLQKYLYIPLGGNRKGTFRTYINLFLVMLISGIWHGAGWTFIVWGILHGLGIVVHKIYCKISRRRMPNRIEGLISQAFTFIYVAFCWIFFRASTMDEAFSIILGMLIPQDGIIQINTWLLFSLLVYAGYLAWLIIVGFRKKNDLLTEMIPMFNLSTIHGLVIFFCFFAITIFMAYFGNTYFIYGKF